MEELMSARSGARVWLAAAAVVLIAAPVGMGARPSSPVSSGPSTARAVAITFDDGPNARTPQIVERLRRAGARATFFQVGASVHRHPELARRAVSVGEIANHTYSHRNLVGLPSAEVRTELVRTSTAIERATGTRPTLFRPPYGRRDARVDAIVGELGMRQILWSVDTEDWRYSSPDRLIARIRLQLRPGGIILFHDHGKATLSALDWLLAELARRNLRAVTVSELLATKR
jgi:peptidoglycan-N-acetylglucosamine deacetylase